MLFTFDEILKRENIPADETVYEQDLPDVRSFRISSGDFYEVTEAGKELKAFASINSVQKTGNGQSALTPEVKQPELSWDELGYYEERLADIKRQLKALKNDEEDITHAHAEDIKALRQEKKRIGEIIEKGRSCQTEKKLIKFKNCLYGASFASVCRLIPRLESVSFRHVRQTPLFVAGIDHLQNALERRRPIGISGGPCLFGVNEVLALVTLKDGTVLEYDYSSGRHFEHNGKTTDFAEDMDTLGEEVVSIDFVNQKAGVTTQEYDSIHCLFEYARALGAKLALPLPDMSYIKYLENVIEGLPEDVREATLKKFKAEAFAISDMYLELIEKMRFMYPQVEAAVVHARDEAMCQLFYEKRASFLTETTIRRLTGIRGKNDAIQDYITMPALPYYLWGITEIIQMDSLDETDSYRKCAKIHKGALRLYAMMYPERISEDGENTIFYAPLKYKEYLV